jgi:GTP-binding protein EngB required for normal cell division
MPYLIVATKCDKLNKTDFNFNKSELEKLGRVIPFSSLKGIGKEELWKAIYEFLEN